jgi:hypothetical protein
MTKVYTYTDEQLAHMANNVLLSVVESLKREKYLTDEQSVDILTNYSIMIETNGWLPKFLSKWMKLDDDKMIFRLVKAIGRAPREDETK